MDNFPLEFDFSFWELLSVIVKVMLAEYQLYARQPVTGSKVLRPQTFIICLTHSTTQWPAVMTQLLLTRLAPHLWM